MEEQIFKEEQDKLEEINEKITEEENIIEEDLKNADMNYSLEDMAKGEVLFAKVKKLEDIKKIKDVPYFARMDFKEDARKMEKLYLEKFLF